MGEGRIYGFGSRFYLLLVAFVVALLTLHVRAGCDGNDDDGTPRGPLRIFVAVDQSNSIPRRSYDQVRSFLKDLTRELLYGTSRDTGIVMYTFATTAKSKYMFPVSGDSSTPRVWTSSNDLSTIISMEQEIDAYLFDDEIGNVALGTNTQMAWRNADLAFRSVLAPSDPAERHEEIFLILSDGGPNKTWKAEFITAGGTNGWDWYSGLRAKKGDVLRDGVVAWGVDFRQSCVDVTSLEGISIGNVCGASTFGSNCRNTCGEAIYRKNTDCGGPTECRFYCTDDCVAHAIESRYFRDGGGSNIPSRTRRVISVGIDESRVLTSKSGDKLLAATSDVYFGIDDFASLAAHLTVERVVGAICDESISTTTTPQGGVTTSAAIMTTTTTTTAAPEILSTLSAADASTAAARDVSTTVDTSIFTTAAPEILSTLSAADASTTTSSSDVIAFTTTAPSTVATTASVFSTEKSTTEMIVPESTQDSTSGPSDDVTQSPCAQGVDCGGGVDPGTGNSCDWWCQIGYILIFGSILLCFCFVAAVCLWSRRRSHKRATADNASQSTNVSINVNVGFASQLHDDFSSSVDIIDSSSPSTSSTYSLDAELDMARERTKLQRVSSARLKRPLGSSALGFAEGLPETSDGVFNAL